LGFGELLDVSSVLSFTTFGDGGFWTSTVRFLKLFSLFSDCFRVLAGIDIFRFNSTMEEFLVTFLSRGECSLWKVSYRFRKSITFSTASNCLVVFGIYSSWTFVTSTVFMQSLISLRWSVSDLMLTLPGTVDVKGLVTRPSDPLMFMNI
jgi:hypothetical protein